MPLIMGLDYSVDFLIAKHTHVSPRKTLSSTGRENYLMRAHPKCTGT